jgi:hypothetical protein
MYQQARLALFRVFLESCDSLGGGPVNRFRWCTSRIVDETIPSLGIDLRLVLVSCLIFSIGDLGREYYI